MNKYTMKELPDLERPYEKLEMHGEKSLSDAELLAIVLRSGYKEETALQVAHRIINECDMKTNGLTLKNISLNRLKEIKGIGRVKAILLKAVFELAGRIESDITSKPYLGQVKIAGEFISKEFNNEKQEKLKIYGLNVKGFLERVETVSVGGLNNINITAREVFRMPIECGCSNIIIAHNHPSGDSTPSVEDIAFTAKIKKLGDLLNIGLLDHFVVGNGNYIGIRENKILKW